MPWQSKSKEKGVMFTKMDRPEVIPDGVTAGGIVAEARRRGWRVGRTWDNKPAVTVEQAAQINDEALERAEACREKNAHDEAMAKAWEKRRAQAGAEAAAVARAKAKRKAARKGLAPSGSQSASAAREARQEALVAFEQKYPPPNARTRKLYDVEPREL